MMKNFKKEKWLLIFGLTIFVVVIYLLWIAISFFVNSLASTDPKIAAAIIGAMTTLLVGFAAVIITQRQIKLREIAEAHREKKIEIYEKYLEIIKSLVSGQNENVTIKAPSQQELVDYLVDYKTEILLWGSPKVIKAQLEFERASALGNDGDSLHIFEAVNNMYKAIREDIGLSNAGLNNLELVKLFLKDPTELDEIKASNK